VRLLLVRHGESQGNLEDRFQGRDEYPLTARGLRQARCLAERLEREGVAPAVIYSSPQERALRTAGCLTEALAAPLVTDPRLCERDVGVLTGLTFAEVCARYPEWGRAWQAANDEWPPIPGEEGPDALARRAGETIASWRARHVDGEIVLAVSHGGILSAMLCSLLGVPVDRKSPFAFGNASLTTVDLAPGRVRLVGLNDLCHLKDEHRYGRGESE